MAFTDPQRAKIYLYLGYSERFLQIDSVLDQAISSIGQNPDAVNIVVDLLADLDTVTADLRAARRRLRFAQVEEVRYQNLLEQAGLRSEGRMSAQRLAAVFGVERRSDAFGTGRTGQPTWVSQLFGNGGAVGTMKQG